MKTVQLLALCLLIFFSANVNAQTSCSGTPTAGTISPASTSVCSSGSTTLTLSGYTTGVTGITFQWKSSPDSVTFTNISGATGTTYLVSSLSATTYYKCVVTCSAGGSASSNIAKITLTTVPAAAITAGGSTTICCSAVTLNANTGSGLSYQWQLNGSTILCPLSSYPLDNNANDNTGSNNGTAVSVTATADRFGNPNSAYHFSGSGSYVNLPYSNFFLTQYTYSVWCRPTSLPASGQYYAILAIGGQSIADQAIMLGNDGTHGNVGLGAGSYNSLPQAHSCYKGSLPTVNQWYHLVLTCDNSSMKFYVNDTLICTISTGGSSPGYLGSPTAATIGARESPTSQNFIGDIDDVRIYSRVLSQTEVQNLYSSCSPSSIICATSSSYSANAAGNYTCVMTNSCGSSTSNTITVTANAGPAATITASGSTAICSGGSVALNANTGIGFSYQWQLNASNISGATSSSYSATTAGNYTCVVSNGCGNTTSNTITTTIAGLTTLVLQPNAAIGMDAYVDNYPPDVNVNSGNNPDLDASAWTINSSSQVARGFIRFDLSSIPTNASIQQATLTLYNNPTSAAGNPAGQHSNLSGSDASWLQKVTGSWSENTITWNNQPATDTTHQVNLPQSTDPHQNYTLDVTTLVQGMVSNPSSNYGFMLRLQTESYYRALLFASSDNADSTKWPKISVTYNNSLLASITAGGPTTFCSGGSVTLSSSAAGTGYTYQWKLNGSTISGATSVSYTASSTGSYTCAVSDGCSNVTTNAIAVTVNMVPASSISAGGSTTICAGSSVTLSANTGTGLSYQWQLNTGNISGDTSASYSATSAGSYTCVVSNSCGGVTSNSISVSISGSTPTATITAGGPTTLCSGGSVTLNANTGTGLSYQWQLNGSNISGATSSSYTATAIGNYTCTVTNSCGSSTSNNITVTITGLATLVLQPNAANGIDAYVDNYPPDVNLNSGNNPDFDASAWTIGGSSQIARGFIRFDLSSIPINASVQQATLTLYNNPTSGAGNPAGQHSNLSGSDAGWLQQVTGAWSENTITWNNQPATTTANEVTVPQSTSGHEDYTLDVTTLVQAMVANPSSNYGFMLRLQAESYYRALLFASSDNADSTKWPKIAIIYNNSLLASIAAGGPTTFCQGGSVTLSSSATGTGYSYQWQLNGSNISGAMGSSYSATSAGSYTCVVSNGCIIVTSNSIAVTVNPLPPAVISANGSSAICTGNSVTLSANTGTGLSYQWQLNNGNISGATSASYSATSAGNYACVVTNSCGNSTSNSITVTISGNAPPATISANGPTTICCSSVTLNANIGSGLSYQWQLNGSNISCPFSYYPLDNNANDYSGSNNGTAYNVTATTDRFGNPNSAYHFSGSGSYVNLPYSNFLLNQFTYSVWCRPTSLPSSGQYYAILAIGGQSTADQAIMLGNDAVHGNVGMGAGSYNSIPQAHSSYKGSLPAVNQWYHLVITCDNNSFNFYINDTLIRSVSTGGSYPGYLGSPFGATIGSRESASSQNFIGDIDDVRIYNRVLSQTEVQNLYSSCSPSSVTCATSSSYSANAAGNYTCLVTNGCGSSTSNTITVSLSAAPAATITASGSTAICAGNSVTLNVATGTGLFYQWQLNGSNISGATSSSYTATGAGNYNCIVSNGCGNTISNTIAVTIVGLTTLVLQPNAANGIDAYVDNYPPDVNLNSGNNPDFDASAWTIGGSSQIVHGFIRFDLSSIPANASVQQATLTLYNNPTSAAGNPAGQHSNLSGSDAGWLQQVTGSWSENTITWNNQPATTTANEVTVPQSTSGHEDYNLDISALVQGMVNNPSSNYGFMLRLQTESYYRALLFASSDNADSTKWPKISITYGTPLIATISAGGPTMFCQGSNVILSASPAGANYQWQLNGSNISGATSSTYSATSAGSYTCVVSTSGCNAATSNSISVSLSASLPLSVSISASDTAICSGTTPVTFTATAVNGGSNPTYQWQINGNNTGTNSSTFTSSSLSNGDVVTCVVTSNSSCVTGNPATSNGITMSVNTALSASCSGTNVTCASGGSVSVSLTGGTQPYFYSWNNGSTQNQLSNLQPQTYSVTVTDTKGCSATCSYNVISNQPAYSCYITNDVLISPTVYQFDLYLLNTSTQTFEFAGGQWGITVNSSISNGGTMAASVIPSSTQLSNATQSPTNLSFSNSTFSFNMAPKLPPGAGSGSIISSTNNGCSSPGTRVATFRITNSLPFVPNTTANPAFNFVAASGKTQTKITAYVCSNNTDITTDGTFYAYNTPGTCLQNVVLNPNNCTLSLSASSTPASCSGGSNGTATAIPSGGTAPFIYHWNNGNTNAQATNLSAQTYSVTLIDANGCAAAGSATVTQPSAISVLLSATNPTTDSAADGAIATIVNGGSSPYAYSWSTGATTSSIAGLTSGLYTVTIIDNNGCSATDSITLVDSWHQNTSLPPSLGRYGAVGFSIGGMGYVGTGATNALTYYNDFWQYDPNTGIWTQLSNLGNATNTTDYARNFAVGFTINGEGYVGTGTNGTNNFSDFWKYDPGTNAWTQIQATFPGGTRRSAVGFSMNGKGYVGTGIDGSTYYQDFYEFNPQTSSWATFPSLPGSTAREWGVGFSINNVGYVGLGENASSYFDDFYVYNPTATAWQAKAAYTGNAREGAVGFSIGSRGYIGTGSDGTNKLQEIYEYDPDNDSWARMPDFIGDPREFAVGFSLAGAGYIGTGLGSLNKDLFQFSPNPEISLDSISPSTSVCQGSTIIIHYTISGSFNTGNVFSVQLSDSLGNFTSPLTIGSISSLSSGTINATIPLNSYPDIHYVIRIVSSGPVILSNNYSGFIIKATPTPVASSESILCLGTTLHLSSSGGSSYLWSGPNGFNSTAQSPVVSNVSVANSGAYTVTVTNSSGCSAATATSVAVGPTAIVSSNSPICNNQSLQLNLLTTGVDFEWSGPNGFTSGSQNPSISHASITASGVYTVSLIDANGCTATVSTTTTVNNCGTTLNLKLFIEGYYLAGGEMQPVMKNEGLASATTLETDTVTVELHSVSNTGVVAETKTAVLMTNGSATAVFSPAVMSQSYWIAVKHRNALQTWSAAPFSFSDINSYDFTTAKNRASGGNMIDVYHEGIWSFYTGDLNQDQNIDLLDFPVLDLGINLGSFGYYSSDLNGDGNSDLLDFPIFDQNLLMGIFSMHP